MTLVNTLFCASGDDNADHNYEDNEDYDLYCAPPCTSQIRRSCSPSLNGPVIKHITLTIILITLTIIFVTLIIILITRWMVSWSDISLWPSFPHFDHHLDHSLKGPVIRHITLTIILINDHSDHFDHHIDHFDVKSKFINKEIQSKKNWQKFLEFWVGLGVPIITIIIISAISKGIIMIITGHHQISIQTPAKAPPRSGSVLLSLLICGACGSSENNWDVYVERK